MSIFDSISKGLNEAVDYERGNTNGVRKRVITVIPVPQYKGIEIRKIRDNLKITQASFAELMGVSVKTVEAWETGRNIPQGPAQRMLDLLKNESGIVDKYVVLSKK
jgi:putative transcriptional regulator